MRGRDHQAPASVWHNKPMQRTRYNGLRRFLAPLMGSVGRHELHQRGAYSGRSSLSFGSGLEPDSRTAYELRQRAVAPTRRLRVVPFVRRSTHHRAVESLNANVKRLLGANGGYAPRMQQTTDVPLSPRRQRHRSVQDVIVWPIEMDIHEARVLAFGPMHRFSGDAPAHSGAQHRFADTVHSARDTASEDDDTFGRRVRGSLE